MTTTFAWRLDGLAVSKTVDESMSQGRPLKRCSTQILWKNKSRVEKLKWSICFNEIEKKNILKKSVKIMFRDSKHQPTWVSCVETGGIQTITSYLHNSLVLKESCTRPRKTSRVLWSVWEKPGIGIGMATEPLKNFMPICHMSIFYS